MNILFLDSIERQTYGGMEEWIRLVASGLNEGGHGVTVCGREGSEFLRRIRTSLPGNMAVGLSISGDFSPATIARIHKEISHRNIDIVVTNFNKDIRLGGLAARIDGSPRVIWSAGLDITKDNLVHRHLTPRLLDGVIVPSRALKNQITRLGHIKPHDVEVIPIGIPSSQITMTKTESARQLRQRYGLPREAIVCVTSGRFVEQKGHQYLLAAIRNIIDRHANTFFLWLGDGPLEQNLRSSAAESGVIDNVIFAGMCDSVDELLAGSDLMIHPSVEEPFGIAILEGMRAGLPVVASRVGGIPEVVAEDESGVLVEAGRPEQLAGAVCHLLSDTVRMDKLGAEGIRRWQQLFSVDEMVNRVLVYFERIAAGERVRGNA